MGDLLQNILLSDVFLLGVMGVVMVLITGWAHARREYPGYILGWLIGTVFVIVMSTFTLNAGVSVEPETDAAIQSPGIFLGLMIGAALGFGLGYGLLALIRGERSGQSRVRRALAMAISTSLTLSTGYLMLISARPMRLVLAVFSLSLSIGVLVHYIFARQRGEATPADIQLAAESWDDPQVEIVNGPEYDLPSPLAQRVLNLQQRIRRPGEQRREL